MLTLFGQGGKGLFSTAVTLSIAGLAGQSMLVQGAAPITLEAGDFVSFG